ncbi:AP2/B3-like transcriptional factor family protein [Striga asiatica]|uniref:AP2/B3-like transcriptional factor family protein n=1 Tax=Striga asiatica TaxID=4170 RepID=A0A5A7QZP9_STRAF|nr:AP2/B3-like transcriptional factor family protein [Striga asiatica]
MDSRPKAFYKIFITEIHKDDLQIPPAFMEKVGHPLPNRVHMIDVRNNIWSVRTFKIGECWYLVNGWSKFARDNLLSTGDLLVFDYYHKGWFSIGIFGPWGNQRLVLGPNKVRIISAHAHKQVSDNDDDNDDDDEDVDTYSNSDSDSDSDDKNESEQEAHCGAESSKTIRGRKIYDNVCNGLDIFSSGRAQRPKNPYFVTKVMPKRKSYLFIPREVVRDYGLNLRQDITLVDPHRREFPARCLTWKDGRRVVSGGWRILCNVNLVREADVIICEFVRGDGGRQFIQISIVRACGSLRFWTPFESPLTWVIGGFSGDCTPSPAWMIFQSPDLNREQTFH